MLALLQSHLASLNLFTAVEVSESLDVLSASAPSADDGTLFVVPWRERAQPPAIMTGGHRQTVEAQFVTVLVIRRHDDPRGAARAAAFDTVKGGLEAGLAGWQPVTGSAVFSLVSTETQGLGNGVSILTQVWQTNRFLTGA